MNVESIPTYDVEEFIAMWREEKVMFTPNFALNDESTNTPDDFASWVEHLRQSGVERVRIGGRIDSLEFDMVFIEMCERLSTPEVVALTMELTQDFSNGTIDFDAESGVFTCWHD